jgi:phosphate-selective porin OprO/OprP
VVCEYTELDAKVSPLFDGPDPTYPAYYVEAGWFLTGETRSYKDGEFGRIKVKNPVLGGGKGGGWGAWQIAGRYDVIDLTDKATAIPSCEFCGEQETWEIVLNWWLNDYTGLQFQYSQSDIKGGPLLFADGTSANANNGATIEGFGTRLRFDW